jgi:hypothetical protein
VDHGWTGPTVTDGDTAGVIVPVARGRA